MHACDGYLCYKFALFDTKSQKYPIPMYMPELPQKLTSTFFFRDTTCTSDSDLALRMDDPPADDSAFLAELRVSSRCLRKSSYEDARDIGAEPGTENAFWSRCFSSKVKEDESELTEAADEGIGPLHRGQNTHVVH